ALRRLDSYLHFGSPLRISTAPQKPLYVNLHVRSNQKSNSLRNPCGHLRKYSSVSGQGTALGPELALRWFNCAAQDQPHQPPLGDGLIQNAVTLTNGSRPT